MAVRNVMQLGNPDLRRPCRPVGEEHDVGSVIADLADTLAHWRQTTGYGRGIAAPQIGVRLRLVYCNLGEPWTLVNPRIVARSRERWTVWDACLSVSLAFFGQVNRHRWVDVLWDDLSGQSHQLRAHDELGELLQRVVRAVRAWQA